MQADYEQSAETARTDPQQSGHIAESTWNSILENWVPNGYRVGTRKYIVPELGSDMFETDIVVFRPEVPRVIQEQTQVPHGAVAAAFSVKRTLDRDGIRDAVDRAVRLRASMDRANLSNRPLELVQPAYPVGLLAMSHNWTSSPEDVCNRVTATLLELDEELAQQPSHSLNLICIGQLGAWRRFAIPSVPQEGIKYMTGDEAADGPKPVSLLLDPLAGNPGPPPPDAVGQFIRDLYSSLEDTNPALKELAYSLRKQVPSVSGSSPARVWTEYEFDKRG